MKKVLLTSICMVASLTWGGNVDAQTTTTTSVTFNASDDGKTLTISGQGDLTTYKTTDLSARVFTDKAVGYVFTDDKGTKVNQGDSYSANNTYYQAAYEYTKVCETEPSGWTYFTNPETNTNWNAEKISNLYEGYYNAWGDKNSVTISGKVTEKTEIKTTPWNSQNENYNYTNMSVYFVCTGEATTGTYTFDELESKGISMLTLDEFKSQYISSKTTYQVSSNYNMFKSSDGGKTYIGLAPNVTYTWTPGEVFYTGTATYSQIEDNDAFFGENGTHSDYIGKDSKEYTFADLLQKKIAGGSYETVKFEKASTEDLLINNDIISKILFITNSGNKLYNATLKTLDLEAATCNELSSETFSAKDVWTPTPVLATLTLPLTKKTTVYSQTTGKDEEKMVVPSQVLGTNYWQNCLTTINIPEGYDRIGDEAFLDRTNLTNVNLPSTLTLIGKKAFCGTKLTSITLNEGLENIGEQAFANTGLTSISFPSSLKTINDGAFYNCRIFGIKFNAGLKYIGNSAFALTGNAKDNAETTIEIPASVRYVGPFAFQFRYYQDVFFYGKEAPIMPLGTAKYDADWGEGAAFYMSSYMGDNGFNEGKDWQKKHDEGIETIYDDAYTQGYANRENYKNNNVYFTMLHFPKDLEDAQRATFTDISRVYKTAEGNQNFCYGKTSSDPNTYVTVGQEQTELKVGQLDAPKDCDFGYQDTYLGRQYIWPSQEQWRRSFVVNYNGYNWNGVDEYRTDLTEGDLAILAYAGYKKADDKHPADAKTGYYSLDELKKIAHMGTRLFVLANADVNVDKEEDKEPEYPIDVKGGQWWTLCVPFNMTKKMIDETFGANTEVCLFDRVIRQVNNITKKNRIVLYFTQNVYAHKTGPKGADGKWNFDKNASAPGEDDVVIYAHESYMIHPTKTDEDAVFVVNNYQLVEGSPTPTIVMGTNQYVGESDVPNNVPYRYVGNYLSKSEKRDVADVKIPMYSYVYAKAGNDKPKFWFLTDDKMTWKPNKCVVQTNERDAGEDDYQNFFDFEATGAKQASFFGADFDDSTTSIDEMEIVAGEKSCSPIYSLDGKLVSRNGDKASLAKGIYVQGGKKFVIK